MAGRSRRGERHNAAGQPALLPSVRLSERDLKFIERYLLHGKAGRAALEAGFAESVAAKPFLLLRKRLIAAEIDRRRAELRAKYEVSREHVIEELSRIAFADPREAFDADGKLLPMHELAEHVARAIASTEVESKSGDPAGRVTKLKFWGKREALRDLGQILGMFTDKLEHSGSVVINVGTGIPRRPGEEPASSAGAPDA